MTTRPIVCVDLETSAFRPSPRGWTPRGVSPHGAWSIGTGSAQPYGVAVEAGWWNLSTGENGSFVPAHNREWVLRYGDPEALIVNRYAERLAEADQDDGTELERLVEQLTGATAVGANPAFDAERWLSGHILADRPDPQPWHHRLGDVQAYYGGYARLPINALLGLNSICEALGVTPPTHEAADDARAAGECLIAMGAVP